MTPTALMLVAAMAQSQPATMPGGGEFPPGDVRIWLIEQSGLMKKAALARAAERPVDAETVRTLIEQNRIDEALDCLMRIVDTQPERMAEALPALWSIRPADGTRDDSSRLSAIVRLAHERARTLPREQSAAAELQLLSADALVDPALGARSRERSADFVKQYAGTEAALTKQISDAVYLPFPERLAMLDTIVAEHPRTGVAARALFEKAFQLGHNAPVGPGAERDPTEHFLQTVAIEKELESGAYPESSETRRAPSLVIGFYAYQPSYRPGNVDRMLAAYAEFVRTHFTLDPVFPVGNGIGYVITQKMADLFAVKGDSGGVDRTLRELERDTRDADGARYLRALYAARAQGGAGPPEDRARARELLAPLAARSGLYARKALATLASLDVQDHDYAAARARYQAYVDRYAGSAYAWLAAIHLGEMDVALGDWKSAEAVFRGAAHRFAANPLAAVIGHEFAARALEAQGDPDRALEEHASSFAAWDVDYGLDYPLSESSPGVVGRRAGLPLPSLGKPGLAGRIAQMRSTLGQPGGTLLERARWLLDTNQPDAAIAIARDLLARFPQSSLVARGRQVMHRAQLEVALDLANIERPGGNPTAARAALDALAGEPFDPVVSVAKIARASALWTGGEQDAARADMTSALKEWAERQSFAPPSSNVEKDVAAIREAVFRPLGGGIFDQARGWNAFRWPATLPAFLVINPDVPVKLTSGELVNVSVSRALSGMPNVLYADTGTLALMDAVLFSLGGTKRRAPSQIMETPNQPVGLSMSILQLWNQFFPARQGHWGGWELTTYPQLTRIEFLDAAHLRAAASVTVGYSGATVVLEKRDDVWIAVKLTNEWIT